MNVSHLRIDDTFERVAKGFREIAIDPYLQDDVCEGKHSRGQLKLGKQI